VPPFDRPGVAIHFAHRMGAAVVLALVAWTASTIRARHPPPDGDIVTRATLRGLERKGSRSGALVGPTVSHQLSGRGLTARRQRDLAQVSESQRDACDARRAVGELADRGDGGAPPTWRAGVNRDRAHSGVSSMGLPSPSSCPAPGPAGRPR